MALERYQINDGDTLQQIARRLLGHADQWWILVNFNKLDHPFIDTSGATYPGKNVLGLGGLLLVPKDIDEPAVKQATVQASPDQYALLFGSDLSLSSEGDLLFDPATGDWQVLTGVPNLVGALNRRLLIRSGLYPYHPEYGSNLEQHIGSANDPTEATAVRLEGIRTVLAEPRVRSIRKMVLNATDDLVALNLLCDVIGADSPVPLNVVIQR